MELSKRKCAPCEGGIPPLKPEKAVEFQKQLSGWGLVSVNGTDTIEKKYKLKNFDEAMRFVNKVAEIAQKEDHHPDITINWNKVTLQLSTHAIKGLSENDFILAAKIDKI